MWAEPHIIPVMTMVGAVLIDFESCTHTPSDTAEFVYQMAKDIGTEKAARDYAGSVLGLPTE